MRTPSTLAALLVATAGLALLATPTLAQPKIPGPDRPKDALTAPSADEAAKKKEATRVLAIAKKAMSETKALSYTADFTSESINTKDAKATPKSGAPVNASIVIARAEAGGWRIAASGKRTIAAKKAGDEAVVEPFEIGFDGVTARSLRTREEMVVERSATDLADVQSFFSGQQAGGVLPWDVLGDPEKLFNNTDDAISEGLAPVNGSNCYVVFIPAADGAKTIPSVKPDMSKAPGKDKKDADSAATEPKPIRAGTRYFFDTADNLPRKIERILLGTAAAAEEKPAQGGTAGLMMTRTLTLADVKTNEKAAAGRFTIEVPDGYRVKADAPKRTKDADKAPASKDGSKPGKLPSSDPSLIAVGSDFPAFSLPDGHEVEKDAKSEKKITNADLKGKVVVLDFWATWCGPCIAAMPAIQELHNDYKDKDVLVFGVNTEDDAPEKAVAFKKKKGYTYGSILKGGELSNQCKISGIPTFIVLGKDGKVAYAVSGFPGKAGLKKNLSAIIDSELKK